MEETSDADVTPDISTDASAYASANDIIQETCSILGDDNNNMVAPEEIAPADMPTAFQLEEENLEEETLQEATFHDATRE